MSSLDLSAYIFGTVRRFFSVEMIACSHGGTSLRACRAMSCQISHRGCSRFFLAVVPEFPRLKLIVTCQRPWVIDESSILLKTNRFASMFMITCDPTPFPDLWYQLEFAVTKTDITIQLLKKLPLLWRYFVVTGWNPLPWRCCRL